MRLPWQKRSNLPITLDELMSLFSYNGVAYPLGMNQSISSKQEEPGSDFRGYIDGIYKQNGVVFACIAVRQLLFSEARFQFRQRVNGRPGDLFGTPALKTLEEPWKNGTTGGLLTRMIQDSDLAGNFYGHRTRTGGIERMRPDWVTIIMGGPEGAQIGDLGVEVIGYAYKPGGPASGRDTVILRPEEVVHFAPMPDPAATYRGMSWLGPVLKEIMGDGAASTHKLKFFENGATPNMTVTLDKEVSADAFIKFKRLFDEQSEGLANAYKTLFLGGGADVQLIGSNMRQMDFKTVQGHGETRIAAAAGVPPIIVGLSEGLDSATYSNYGQARRAFADLTMRPLWREAAGALAPLVDVPAAAELWYDDRDIPFLQEDMQDAATIQAAQAVTMRELVNAGYDPETVKTFVSSGDPAVLQHTGLVSVQLQAPGAQSPSAPADEPARMLADYIVRRAARGHSLDHRDVLAYIEGTAVELPPAA